MGTKKCVVCKTLKEITQYYKCKTIKDGLSRSCKVCHTQMNKKWQQTDKGLHYHKNWQLLPKNVNRKKNNKILGEFA